jgi:hypothetical protein
LHEENPKNQDKFQMKLEARNVSVPLISSTKHTKCRCALSAAPILELHRHLRLWNHTGRSQ